MITRLVCSGCGAEASHDDPYPFRCPNSIPLSPRGEGSGLRGRSDSDGSDVDHVIRRELAIESPDVDHWRRIFLDDEPNPFVRYRSLFHSYGVAIERGMSDSEFVEMVRSIDRAIESVDGVSFRETPFGIQSDLNGAIGRRAGNLWIKDDTRNVSGSHKARHLMGILLWLEVARRTGLIAHGADEHDLAIASCGNAALAAAVVAKAAGRPLHVFIPTDAHPNVTRQLTALGADLVVCPREESVPGDPCMHRFHESVATGSLPFGVQGNENGLTLEGGLTLGYEIVSSLLRSGDAIDRLFIQIGGGALASSCIQAFDDAKQLGLVSRIPMIHAVQTEGAYPLPRAWDRIARTILGEEIEQPDSAPFPPATGDPARDRARATEIASPAMKSKRRDVLRFAATHRSRFMWPWESAPHSVAHGILDDETYDWLAIVEGMLETGGFPVVASEDDLRAANEMGRTKTGIDADPTGTSGLAGLLRLVRDGIVADDESAAVLFTGRTR